MDNPTINRWFEWAGSFVTGFLGIRLFHHARIKADSQDFRALSARVGTLERKLSATESLASTSEDHEQRLRSVERRQERDHAELIRKLSRIEDRIDRALAQAGD